MIWVPSALDDIESIAEYIAKDSVEMTSLFVSRLFNATDHLYKFPLSGRIIPEINNPDCRAIVYGAYRIMYRVEEMLYPRYFFVKRIRIFRSLRYVPICQLI